LYREKVLTSQLFLRGCSALSPEQILLFGGYDLKQYGGVDDCDNDGNGNGDTSKNGYKHQIRGVLDGWIAVEGRNSEKTIDLFLRARENIEMIFERKIMYPNRQNDDRFIAGVRELFDSLAHDENSRVYEKESETRPDDFHDFFLEE